MIELFQDQYIAFIKQLALQIGSDDVKFFFDKKSPRL